MAAFRWRFVAWIRDRHIVWYLRLSGFATRTYLIHFLAVQILKPNSMDIG